MPEDIALRSQAKFSMPYQSGMTVMTSVETPQSLGICVLQQYQDLRARCHTGNLACALHWCVKHLCKVLKGEACTL